MRRTPRDIRQVDFRSARRRRARQISVEVLEDRKVAAAFLSGLPTDSSFKPNLDQLFVANVYNDSYNRPVDPVSLKDWTGFLARGGTPLQVAKSVAFSEEFLTNEVQALYPRYLGRLATPAEVRRGLNVLDHGGTLEQLARGIAGSREYFKQSGSTKLGFLFKLYADVLDRPIDANGLRRSLILFNHGAGRVRIAGKLLGSAEFDGDLVSTFYQLLLNEPPDAAGAGYVQQLRAGAREEQVFAEIMGSAAFYALPKTLSPDSAYSRPIMVLTPYTPLFEGIDTASGVDHSQPDQPIAAHAMRIDLTNPHIQFLVSPGILQINPPEQQFLSTRVAEFLKTNESSPQNLVLAINGNLWLGTVSHTQGGQPLEPLGLVISGGTTVEPALNRGGDSGFYETALAITPSGQASILQTNAPKFNPAAYESAVTGTGLVLSMQNGLLLNVSDQYAGPLLNGRAARTVIGLSLDHRYLYLVAIDGNDQTTNQYGATIFEAGEWLRAFGGVTGMNIDGGGSTTMVISDRHGGVIQLSDSSVGGGLPGPENERFVAIQFGVGLN